MTGRYKNDYGTTVTITSVAKHKRGNYVLGHTDGGSRVYMKESEFLRRFKRL